MIPNEYITCEHRSECRRKSAGLVPTDDVRLTYTVLPPPPNDTEGEAESNGGTEDAEMVDAMFEQQATAFTKAVSKGVSKAVNGANSGQAVAEAQ